MEFSFRNVVVGVSVVVIAFALFFGMRSPVGLEQSNTEAASLIGDLPAPDSLTAQRVSSSRVELDWVYTSARPTGFEIERTSDASCADTFAKVSQLSGAARHHSDTGLSAAVSYCYRVKAFMGSGAGRVYSTYTYSLGQMPPPGTPPPSPTPTPTPTPSPTSSREEAALVKFAQLHFTATAKIARNAALVNDLPRLQQLNEGVSDNPNDINKRVAHFYSESPTPIFPPAPLSPDLDESAIDFTHRSLLFAAAEADGAATLTDLRAIQAKARLIMVISDTADLQLRIALRELRGE
jgi:hypothetical protein